MAVVLVNGDDNADAINELFEAVTIVLIYFVVGTVVWIMSEHVRKDSQELRRNYEQLTLIQSRLLKDERLAAVGRLAGAIAHEIRNPVAAISSSLAAAQGDSLPAAVRQEMWHIAAREASRLEKLTNDFLFYARARPLEPRPTDIADMMRYIADVIRAKASETAVAIHADCSPALRALVDDFQLHGALLNLALNAVEASSAGDSVDILAQLVGGEAEKSIEIDIRNSGSAIPAGVASRIFEPFVTTKAAGTGLGLAIAQNVARAHGGSLELTENRPGNVRFTLRIPYRACPAAIRESSAAPSQLPPDAARSLALAHNGEKN
jgi:two-component system sensor histidine kinase HydH